MVKEYKKRKILMNDKILMEKALAFAYACSLTEGSDILDKVWLENFRKKNNMLFALDAPYTEYDLASRIE